MRDYRPPTKFHDGINQASMEIERVLEAGAAGSEHQSLAFYPPNEPRLQNKGKAMPVGFLLGPSKSAIARLVLRRTNEGNLEFAKFNQRRSLPEDLEPLFKPVSELDPEQSSKALQKGLVPREFLEELCNNLKNGHYTVVFGLPVATSRAFTAAKNRAMRVPPYMEAEHPHMIRTGGHHHELGLDYNSAVSSSAFVKLADSYFQFARGELIARHKETHGTTPKVTIHHAEHPIGGHSVVVIASKPMRGGV